ncbi:MAG TPA: NRDE family protein, partial [Pseudomonas sp.]|nr:NRDE family protein [Pseudomonas sp.]
VSNAGLDTPWPKLEKAKAALARHLDDPQPDRLFRFLADPESAPEAQLPSTGVGMATEKLLSSVFIASPNYGTRASTVLIVNADGSRRLIERSFGPYGGRLGEVQISL